MNIVMTADISNHDKQVRMGLAWCSLIWREERVLHCAMRPRSPFAWYVVPQFGCELPLLIIQCPELPLG